MAFHKLVVWQKSMELVKDIYVLTRQLPKDELFGLMSQMRRASVSIPSNIAEGVLRNSKKELHRFLMIALGSSAELETQLILVTDIHSLPTDVIMEKLKAVQKMMSVLAKKL